MKTILLIGILAGALLLTAVTGCGTTGAAVERGGEPLPAVRFRAHTIDAGERAIYQAQIVDVNADGRPDILATVVPDGPPTWYENPGWERHVIAPGLESVPLWLAAHDLNGDGYPELAIAAGYSTAYSKSSGQIYLLEHQSDPRDEWWRRELDKVPMSHRMHFADVDNDGRVELVVAPITGQGRDGLETFSGLTPLYYYATENWERRVIADDLFGAVHGMEIVDWDGRGGADILIAGFGGIQLIRRQQSKTDQSWWTKDPIHRGNDGGEISRRGSSDVVVGRLAGGDRFIAAIEPLHGDQIVVYTNYGGTDRVAGWRRRVIDDSFSSGHALASADFNGDGIDEIVAGDRAGDASVYVYYARDAAGSAWQRQLLDEKLASTSCSTGDLDGDGRQDVVCASHEKKLRWYRNLGP